MLTTSYAPKMMWLVESFGEFADIHSTKHVAVHEQRIALVAREEWNKEASHRELS